MRGLPVGDPQDPDYRRLRYSRYADDHLLGFIGPKAEAEAIKGQLARFLRDNLGLELNADKTLVTHARTRAARYLGYEITVQHADHKTTNGRRSVNGKIALRVPRDVIRSKSAPFLRRGKPERRPDLLNYPDHEIIGRYAAQWRGYLQYYLLAHNVWRLNRLQWVMLTSMLKTLAGKHRSTVSKMANKYQATIDTPSGPRVCFQTGVERAGRRPLVARFGGIPLARRKDATLVDRRGSRSAAANRSVSPIRRSNARIGNNPASLVSAPLETSTTTGREVPRGRTFGQAVRIITTGLRAGVEVGFSQPLQPPRRLFVARLAE